MAEGTVEWAVLPGPRRILRVRLAGSSKMSRAERAAFDERMAALYRFADEHYRGRPFYYLALIEFDALAFDNYGEAITHAALDLVRDIGVERGAHVTEIATLRLQYGRLFRERGFGDQVRAFATENEALKFLEGD
jgi:hypothetical protein